MCNKKIEMNIKLQIYDVEGSVIYNYYFNFNLL